MNYALFDNKIIIIIVFKPNEPLFDNKITIIIVFKQNEPLFDTENVSVLLNCTDLYDVVYYMYVRYYINLVHTKHDTLNYIQH